MTAWKKPKAKKHGFRIIILIALVGMIFVLVLEKNLNQIMLDMAYAQAYSMAVETINGSVRNVMQSGVHYEDLIATHMDAEGRITMLHANTMRMNELALKAALMAQERLALPENKQIQIPMGSALGIQFLAGSGPLITLQIVPVGSVKTQFVTEFESAGINQTRHKISLVLSTTVRLVVPRGSKRVDVVSTVPVAETIIVGEVPESLVNFGSGQGMLNLLP